MKRDIGTYKLGSNWKLKDHENLGYLTIVSLYYHEGIFKAELHNSNHIFHINDDSDLLEQEDIREKSLNLVKEHMKDHANVKRIQEFFDSNITFQARQRNRVYDRVKDLYDHEFYNLIKKFLIWEIKFISFNLNTHEKLKNSHIFYALLDMFEKYGEEHNIDEIYDSSIKYKGILINSSEELGYSSYEFSKGEEILFYHL